MGYPLSVIRGLVHSLPCSRVAQIGRKTVRTWISFRKNRMVDDKKDQRQKPRNGSNGARRERFGGRRDSGWRNRGPSSVRKSNSSSSSSSTSPSRRKRREKQQKVKEAQKVLEKYDPQYQQWKEEAKKKEGAVELQEQAEVLANVMKEQFDQTMDALSPSLITPPPFPPSPPVFQAYFWLWRREEDKMICCGLRNFDGLKRSCCTRCPLVGSPEVSSSKLLGSSSGTADSWRPWASSLLVMVVERPCPERRRRGQAWCLT